MTFNVLARAGSHTMCVKRHAPNAWERFGMETETNGKADDLELPDLVTPGVLADIAMVTRWRTPDASVEQQTRESRIGRAIMALLLAHLYANETERRDALRRALQIVAALSAEGES